MGPCFRRDDDRFEAWRNPVMTPLRLTAGAASFTVSTVLTPADNPTIPAHALHRHALDSLHHHRCAGAGRAQCDAAAVDRTAPHLGPDQYPLPVRLSVLACFLCRGHGRDRRPFAVADAFVLAVAVARGAQPDRRHRAAVSRD